MLDTQTATQEITAIGSVLVIDDHPLYCDALEAALERILGATAITKATSLRDGLKLARQKSAPELIILDLYLPDVTGLSGYLKLKDEMPDVPILVVSAESSNETITALFNVGAAGFVSKGSSHEVLQQALTAILQGKKFLPPGYIPSSRSQVRDMSSQQIARKFSELSRQQNRIVKLICDGKPNKVIAYEMALAESTVKAHITALLRKLGVSNRTQVAVLVKNANPGGPSGIPESDTGALLG